jgi:4-hydroxy-3-methylbut-2-enyl diphosphate reductase
MTKKSLHVEKASIMGFCSGVRRAISILERKAAEAGPLQSLGPAVHNRLVVEKLAARGVGVAEGPDRIIGSTVAIPSHGIGPATLEELRKKGLRLVDTTCPIVRKAQMAAKNLAKAGFFVVIFGDPEHPEVRGLLGWAGTESLAVTDVQPVAKLENWPKKLGVLSQTTQNSAQFVRFIQGLLDIAQGKFAEIRIINTICATTHRRQEAAAKLTHKSDLMIVVGGKDSSNTKRLAEICRAGGVETHHVETAQEIEASWLSGKRRIGVTAGASTPDSSVDEVIARLKELSESKKDI